MKAALLFQDSAFSSFISVFIFFPYKIPSVLSIANAVRLPITPKGTVPMLLALTPTRSASHDHTGHTVIFISVTKRDALLIHCCHHYLKLYSNAPPTPRSSELPKL